MKRITKAKRIILGMALIAILSVVPAMKGAGTPVANAKHNVVAIDPPGEHPMKAVGISVANVKNNVIAIDPPGEHPWVINI